MGPAIVVALSLYDFHPDHSDLAVYTRTAPRQIAPVGGRIKLSAGVWSCLIHELRPWKPIGGLKLVLIPDERARRRQAISRLAHFVNVVPRTSDFALGRLRSSAAS